MQLTTKKLKSLILEVLKEDWRDTSWKTDDGTVTIGDVVDYLGDSMVELDTTEVRNQVLKSRGKDRLPTRGQDRIDAANLDFPIIVLRSGGQFRSVLDGNHRLQKAADLNIEKIKAKILDLDDPKTPELFKNIFG
jgi:hypothetical protein